MVTQYVAYYRNDSGGIGIYSWVNDTELEDIEDYQARRLERCAGCGATKQIAGEKVTRVKESDQLEEGVAAAAMAGLIASGEGEEYPAGLPLERDAVITETIEVREGICPYCGSEEWTEGEEEYEEIYQGFVTSGGVRVPGGTFKLDENGKPYLAPTKIPFYKPNVYPIVLQKNTSVFGRFLGESDVDKIADQQNTVNRMERKIIDLLISAGSVITLPPRGKFNVDPKDAKKIYLDTVELLQFIKKFDFTGDITPHMVFLEQAYEEARQVLGITDSFQGRRDPTAKSGIAKQFSAAQSAGRLESKRVMKDAAYARLFELIFKFKLAYADEPRPVVATNEKVNFRTRFLTGTTSWRLMRPVNTGGMIYSYSPATLRRRWRTTGSRCGRTPQPSCRRDASGTRPALKPWYCTGQRWSCYIIPERPRRRNTCPTGWPGSGRWQRGRWRCTTNSWPWKP